MRDYNYGQAGYLTNLASPASMVIWVAYGRFDRINYGDS